MVTFTTKRKAMKKIQYCMILILMTNVNKNLVNEVD